MTQTELLALLDESAGRYGARPALREKRRGVWQEVTFADYRDRVRAAASNPHRERAIDRPEALIDALAAGAPPFASESLLEEAKALRAEGELFSLDTNDARLFVAALASGLCVSFPESPKTLLSDLREIGPHSLFAKAAFWEELHELVQTKMAEATPLNRFLYRSLIGKRGPLANFVLIDPLKDRIGLSRVRRARAEGPVPPEAAAFFAAIGIPLQGEAH